MTYISLKRTGTLANRPAASDASGVIYRCTDVPYAYISDGTSWRTFEFINQSSTPSAALNVSDFTWVNQGVTTATTFGNAIYMSTTDSSGSAKYSYLVKSFSPSFPTAFTLTACLTFEFSALSGATMTPLAGIVLYDSVSGKANTFGVWGSIGSTYAIGLIKDQMTTSTSRNATTNTTNLQAVTQFFWLRVYVDGFNTYYQYSNDGANFVTWTQEAKNTFVTPNRYGIFVAPYSTSTTVFATAAFHSLSMVSLTPGAQPNIINPEKGIAAGPSLANTTATVTTSTFVSTMPNNGVIR